MARSGLFVAPVPGTPPVGTAPADARLALGGWVGTTPQLVSGGGVTTSSSTMQVTVAAAVWQLPDASTVGGTFLSATDAITLTLPAAPGTGSQITFIVVKQNDYGNGDADSRVNVSLLSGTAGAPGVAPTVGAAFYNYAKFTVAAGNANSAAATLVVNGVSTFNAPTLHVADLNALALTPGVTSQICFVDELGAQFSYAGGVWSQDTAASFASAATRTTAYAKGAGAYLVEGSSVFRTDLGMVETYFTLYNASTNPGGRERAGWYTQTRTTGLIPIAPTSVTLGSGSYTATNLGQITFTGASTITLNGVFTGAFDNYFVKFSSLHSSGDSAYVRFASSGTANSSANYSTTQMSSQNGTSSGASTSAATYLNLGFVSITYRGGNYDLNVFNPFRTDQTTLGSVGAYASTMYNTRGLFSATTSFDGITFGAVTGGTFTGTVTVYGYGQ